MTKEILFASASGAQSTVTIVVASCASASSTGIGKIIHGVRTTLRSILWNGTATISRTTSLRCEPLDLFFMQTQKRRFTATLFLYFFDHPGAPTSSLLL